MIQPAQTAERKPMCPRCGSDEISRGGLLSRQGVSKYDILTDTTGYARCKFCDHRAPTCSFNPAPRANS